MPSQDFHRYDPPRPVEVWTNDGRWVTGWLRAWIRDRGDWYGSVTYTTGIGETYMRSLPAARIRERET